jgi:hypothetical protein
MHGLARGDLLELGLDSTAAPGLPFAVIQRLARHTLEFNPRVGLGGELDYADGRFALRLEGRAEVLLPLAARIFADRRHVAIRLSAFGPIARRRFDGWRVAGFGLDDAGPTAEAANLRFLKPRAGSGPAAGHRFGARPV